MKLLNKEDQARIHGGICTSNYCDIEELNLSRTPIILPKDINGPLLPGPVPMKPREQVEKY